MIEAAEQLELAELQHQQIAAQIEPPMQMSEAAVAVDEFGLPIVDDEEFFAQIMPMTEEEVGATFDELLALAAEQPDDRVAQSAIRTLLKVVHERGDISLSMRMAVTLGAMACLHSHLEGLANEAGETLTGSDHDEKSSDHTKEKEHDEKNCEDCKAGKACKHKK